MKNPTLILLAVCSYVQLTIGRLSTSGFAKTTEAPVTALCGTCYFIAESTAMSTNVNIVYSTAGKT